MARLALICLALVAAPAPAEAASLVAAAYAAATSISLATVAVNLAAAVVFKFASQALFGPKKPQGQDVRRKLTQIDSAPVWRNAYGVLRLGGYLIGRGVAGDTLYLGILMNSRFSAGPFTLHLDGREVTLSGDAYDFDGPGAAAIDGGAEHDALIAGHVRAWIGRGAQETLPADILAECPEMAVFDAYAGMTVLWLALDFGNRDDASSRWPSAQPEATLTGMWSLLYDPRDASRYGSANHALVAFDMLRNTDGSDVPFTRIDTASFAAGADICDRAVALRDGGTIPRYGAAGLWEVSDDLQTFHAVFSDMLLAGMAQVVEVGGEWRYIAGQYRQADTVLTDAEIIGDDLEISLIADPADVVNRAGGSFISPERGWERAALPDYTDRAALSADGGEVARMALEMDWVTHPAQAARIMKRAVALRRMERRITGTWSAAALALHVGDVVAIQSEVVPSMAGEYEVAAWALALDPEDDETGTYRLSVPMTLQQVSPAVDDWTAAEDEPDFEAAPDLQTGVGLALLPTDILIIGTTVDAGGSGTVFGARVSFDPATGGAPERYELRWRRDLGGGTYGEFGPTQIIEASLRDAAGRVYGYAYPLETAEAYEFQIRTIGLRGRSDWAIGTATPVDAVSALAAPTADSAGVVAGGVDLEFTTPADPADPADPTVARLRVWRNADDDFGAASIIADIPAVAAASIGLTDDAPATGANFYFATVVDSAGGETAASASLSATIT